MQGRGTGAAVAAQILPHHSLCLIPTACAWGWICYECWRKALDHPHAHFPYAVTPSQVSLEEESQNPPAVGHWKTLMPSRGDKEEPEGGCQDAGGVHEPQSTEQLNVSRLRSSSVEIREKGSEFLRDELHKAQKVSPPGFWGIPGEGGTGWSRGGFSGGGDRNLGSWVRCWEERL